MRTKVEFQGNYTIVQVSGRLDIDKTTLFKLACIKSLKGAKVIFSLENLSFVGSTGILNFFQALKEVHELNSGTCRIVGLNNDFKRIIHLADFQSIELHETLEMATTSFERPMEQIVVPHPVMNIEILEDEDQSEDVLAQDLASENAVLSVEVDSERNS